MYGEAIKGVVALVMAWPVRAQLCERPHITLPPVILFVIMNMLSFWSIKRLPATLSVILIQLKLVWTAIFARLVLARPLLVPRTFAVVALFLSCAMATLQKSARREDPSASQQATHVLAVFGLLVETMLSGATSVYMQCIFRMDVGTMWRRNVQLAAFSFLLYAATASEQRCSFAIDGAGLALTVLSAAGGLLAALSLLYAGAVGKTVATAASIALTILLEHAFVLHTVPSAMTAALCASVLNAVVMYSAL